MLTRVLKYDRCPCVRRNFLSFFSGPSESVDSIRKKKGKKTLFATNFSAEVKGDKDVKIEIHLSPVLICIPKKRKKRKEKPQRESLTRCGET